MTNEKCAARVQFGTSTYAMRNKDRPCANAATNGGFCARHQHKIVTPDQSAAFAELRASILKDATS